MSYILTSNNFSGVVYSFSKNGFPRIRISVSSNVSETYSLRNIFDYLTPNAHWASDYDSSYQQHLTIEFLGNKYFLIEKYSIQSHSSDIYYLYSWKFTGSNNGINWTTLHSATQVTDLALSGVGIYQINPSNALYSMFRIQMTGPTISGDNSMRISKIDLYGFIYSHSNQICSNIHYSKFTSILIIFIFCILDSTLSNCK